MKTPLKKALIIGGGVAGPATALALQHVGIEAVIYEANETPVENKGSFLTVATNGVQALRTLDAFDAVMARGFWVSRMQLYSGTGKRLGEMSQNGAGIAIPRHQLASALGDEAMRRGIALQTGKRLVDAWTTADGVTAQFADGTHATGDLLIGADGIHSRVRTIIDRSAPAPRYVGLVGLGGVAVAPEVPPVPETFTFVFGKRAFFGWVSSPKGETYWFANIPSAQEPERQTLKTISPQQWKRQLTDLFAHDAIPATALISATDDQDGFVPTISHDLSPVPVWYQGAMVLVGDAAHTTTPSSGQGASLALEDSLVLAKSLRDLSSLSQALAAYEALRRPRIEKVARLARRTNQGKVAGPLLRRIQDLLFPIALKYFVHSDSENWLYQSRIDWDEPVSNEVEIPS
jgi:FAD-dependent urate hydroxylase